MTSLNNNYKLNNTYEHGGSKLGETCYNKRRDFLECVRYYPRGGNNGNNNFPKKCTLLFWNWSKDCDKRVSPKDQRL